MLGIKPRALHILGKHSTNEFCPQLSILPPLDPTPFLAHNLRCQLPTDPSSCHSLVPISFSAHPTFLPLNLVLQLSPTLVSSIPTVFLFLIFPNGRVYCGEVVLQRVPSKRVVKSQEGHWVG
jgi:hypothetical protein